MNIDPNGVVPPLSGTFLKNVMAAAQHLNFDALTDVEIGELGKNASEHNPKTGFQMDSFVALACRLELKGRQMAVTSDGDQSQLRPRVKDLKMIQLNDAIEALKLAKECGGENDRDQYAKAYDGLVTLRDKILRHDQNLNATETAPTGDDYNEILAVLGLAESLQEVQPFVGKLWWNADDMAEAQQMQANYLAKGAISVELKPEADRPIVSVIVALDRNRAHEILGYEVGDEEWLDLSGDAERATPAPRG